MTSTTLYLLTAARDADPAAPWRVEGEAVTDGRVWLFWRPRWGGPEHRSIGVSVGPDDGNDRRCHEVEVPVELDRLRNPPPKVRGLHRDPYAAGGYRPIGWIKPGRARHVRIFATLP